MTMAWVMGAVAAVTLAAGGASAATVDFDGVDCGLCDSVEVDGYLFNGGDDISAGGPPSRLTFNYGTLELSRLDGRDFFVSSIAGSFVTDEFFDPLDDVARLDVTFVGAQGRTTYFYDGLGPHPFVLGGSLGPVSSVLFSANLGDGYYADVDLYSLELSAVPLPASAMLLGAALTGLGMVRRRSA